MVSPELERLCINTIRMLSIDAVQKAKSGHPGMPLGAAAMAYVLWTRHLRHDPQQPSWPDRDRFVLSAGHASALLYSLLFLTGYDVSLDDLKHFRQWGSRTAGHPERSLGIEATTGPLGQGFGNAIGMAIAERWLAATFNRDGFDVVNHFTYVLTSDGDMMEGVVAEAASLAGTLRLGRLIVLYDANRVTLSATTDLTFSEDVGARFAAYGWHVQSIDGDDVPALDEAIRVAQSVSDQPSLIVARTHIGYGSPNKQDTWHAHGEPLGEEEVRLTKQALGWIEDRPFHVPERALEEFRSAVPKGGVLNAAWQQRVAAYRIAYPTSGAELMRLWSADLPKGWETTLPVFTIANDAVATRDAGAAVINAVADVVGNLIGGSADLDPSTRTTLKGRGDFESPSLAQATGDVPTQGTSGGVWSYAGRNIHFGVREHAMAAAMTGMALHGGVIPYGSTFLAFSDYMRPSIRLAALSKAHVIYIWTHDSIALGEDGPTHQPVEQLAGLRSIPNMLVIRPSDATETVEAWRVALEHRDGPVGLVLTRQAVPVLDRTRLSAASGLRRGGYVLADADRRRLDVILIATGSEVSLALSAHAQLTKDGIGSRVVSMPCWELFDRQSQRYREDVLPSPVRARVSIEAGSPFGWERYVGTDGAIIGVNGFGASGPGSLVMREFGFTTEHIVKAAKAVIKRCTTRLATINS
jgi:transketolase